MKTLRD